MRSEKSERGAVYIEGILCLTVFLFTIVTLFNIYHVTLAQARVSAALNATAKEISQYSYLYDLTGLNDRQANISINAGSANAVINDLTESQGFYDTLNNLGGAVGTLGSEGYNSSFIAYIKNQGIDAAKGAGCGMLAKQMMRKHFGSDPDKCLKSLGIELGMAGLNMTKSRIFPDGTSSDIILDVQYQVELIKLLDINIKMNFENCARTMAWTA